MDESDDRPLQKMDKWRGVLRASPSSVPHSHFKVAASLCLSSSSKTLTVPATNAVFFYGDRVADGTRPGVIEEMSEARNVVDLLVSKFGRSVNAWVVEASAYNGPFAVYREFVPTVDKWGNPRGYAPEGFPAAATIVALLSNCVEQVRNIISEEQNMPLPTSSIRTSSASASPPKTVILGFSKSGVVLNQIVTELAHLNSAPRDATNDAAKPNQFSSPDVERPIFPISNGTFLQSISQLHYVDVGLNAVGAYITNQGVIKRIAETLHMESPGIRVVLHGTPRQWCDRSRPWIREEKDRMLQILEHEAITSDGKLEVAEKFYFANIAPSLQMHFEIIKELDIS